MLDGKFDVWCKQMQTYKKAIFFVLLATVLVSVSQVLATASVFAYTPKHDHDGDWDDMPSSSTSTSNANSNNGYCTQYLNIADPAQAMMYNEFVAGLLTNNNTALCVP